MPLDPLVMPPEPPSCLTTKHQNGNSFVSSNTALSSAASRTLIFSFPFLGDQDHEKEDCPAEHNYPNGSDFRDDVQSFADSHLRLLLNTTTTTTTAKTNNSRSPGMFNILSNYEAALQTIDAKGFCCTSEPGAKHQHPAARQQSVTCGGLLVQRIPDQQPKMHNRRVPIRRTCDVSMAAFLRRDLEVELVILRTNPACLG